jgi:hypothetical protein
MYASANIFWLAGLTASFVTCQNLTERPSAVDPSSAQALGTIELALKRAKYNRGKVEQVPFKKKPTNIISGSESGPSTSATHTFEKTLPEKMKKKISSVTQLGDLVPFVTPSDAINGNASRGGNHGYFFK